MQITQPTLCIHINQAKNNLLEMKQKADEANIKLRPHFKTHQSAEIGHLAQTIGITSCTVSSIEMALYFAQNGWDNITVAFPVNILEIERINQLAQTIQLNLLVENNESIQFLQENLKSNIAVWIKVDCGYGRTGVAIDNYSTLQQLVQEIENSSKLNFKGFLTHNGGTYKCRSKEEILELHRLVIYKIANLKAQFPNAKVSYGDTPSCSVASSFDHIDEIRPGNFVYYDLMQHHIGSCSLNQIAATMKVPVVATHPERNAVVVYGGGVHFSKETFTFSDQTIVFGLVKNINNIPVREDIYLTQLSQEHGILTMPDSLLDEVKLGDIVEIIPVHSCLTANLMKHNTVYL
ncbi:alanine racemase [Prolixibacteraceae bacterium JC049]|nr:alanine racemase [Prolixibacteraceae bacterium JC049]